MYNIHALVKEYLELTYIKSKTLSYETDGTYKPKILAFQIYLCEKNKKNTFTKSEFEKITEYDVSQSMNTYIELSKQRQRPVKSQNSLFNYCTTLKEFFRFLSNEKDILNKDLTSKFTLWESDKEQFKKITSFTVDKYNLREGKPIQPINENDYYRVYNLLSVNIEHNLEHKDNYKFLTSSLMLRFVMVYGLKFKQIKSIFLDDLHDSKQQICIGNVNLPVSKKEYNDLIRYKSIRMNSNAYNNKLFYDEKLDTSDSRYMGELFSYLRSELKIGKKYNKKSQSDKDVYELNNTCLSKFAIIKMLETGIPDFIIKCVTGADKRIIDDCIEQMDYCATNYQIIDSYFKNDFLLHTKK